MESISPKVLRRRAAVGCPGEPIADGLEGGPQLGRILRRPWVEDILPLAGGNVARRCRCWISGGRAPAGGVQQPNDAMEWHPDRATRVGVLDRAAHIDELRVRMRPNEPSGRKQGAEGMSAQGGEGMSGHVSP